MAVSLLDLPAELRNQIYHYAVVNLERILIDLSNLDGTNTKQPALTKVCRQVRAEATTIYYLENRFNLTIPDDDGKRQLPFYNASQKHIDNNKINVSISGNGGCSWANLMEWVKLCYDEVIMWRPGFPKQMFQEKDEDRLCRVRATVFETLEEMEDYDWEKIEAVLGRIHFLVVGYAEEWI